MTVSNKKHKTKQSRRRGIDADHSRARFFSLLPPQALLEKIDDLINVDAQLGHHKLVTAASGRLVYGLRSRHGSGHSAGDEHSATHHLTEVFSRPIVQATQKPHAVGALSRVHRVEEFGLPGILRAQVNESIMSSNISAPTGGILNKRTNGL